MTDTTTKSKFLNGRIYDQVKFIAQVLLPAAGTLYFALSGLWGFPDTEQILGTVTAVDTFLGVMLGLSSLSYNNSNAKYDGAVNVVEGPLSKTFSLDLNTHPDDIQGQKEVLLKVNPTVTTPVATPPGEPGPLNPLQN